MNIKRLLISSMALTTILATASGCHTADSQSPDSPSAGGSVESSPAPESAGTSSSSSRAPSHDAAPSPSSSDGTQPTQTIAADGPEYADVQAALPDSIAVVEGKLTRRVKTVEHLDDGADASDPQSYTTWAVYDLTITDPLGAKTPASVALVDFDRSGQVVESETAVVMEGLEGLWALNTADSPDAPLMKEVGYSYYPVYFIPAQPLSTLPDGSELPHNMGESGSEPADATLEAFNEGATLKSPTG